MLPRVLRTRKSLLPSILEDGNSSGRRWGDSLLENASNGSNRMESLSRSKMTFESSLSLTMEETLSESLRIFLRNIVRRSLFIMENELLRYHSFLISGIHESEGLPSKVPETLLDCFCHCDEGSKIGRAHV